MTTNWTEILKMSPTELDFDTLEFVRSNLPMIDANSLNSDELRKYFELSCFLIKNDSASDKDVKMEDDSNGELQFFLSKRLFISFISNFPLKCLGQVTKHKKEVTQKSLTTSKQLKR